MVQRLTSGPDMRVKSISTYVMDAVHGSLAELADGDVLEFVTDAGDALGNDIRAWCPTTGHELVGVEPGDQACRYLIRKRLARRSGRRFAAVLSDPGLEELLPPLGFARAAPLKGLEVSLYFQGLAVQVLVRAYVGNLHVPAQLKLAQLRDLGAARLYICGPSMEHYNVHPSDLAFGDMAIAEYLTFMAAMAAMADADVQLCG